MKTKKEHIFLDLSGSNDQESVERISRKKFLIKSLSSSAAILSGTQLYRCVTTAAGKRAFIILPESEEIEMGNAAFADVMKKNPKSSNTQWGNLLKQCGSRVSKASDRPDYNWQFELIASKQVNAFCVPGGKVAYYEGIMPYCKNEAGIAVVMGHEVAHAVSRHGAQRISQALAVQISLGLVGSTLLKNNKYKNVIMAGLGVGATVGVILPYSREHEYEADSLGLKYMAKAGYDPEAGIDFWERFSKLDKSGGTDFLSTHPLSSKRIENMKMMLPKVRKHYQSAPEKFGEGQTI